MKRISAALVVAVAALVAAGSGSAAAPQPQSLSCAGLGDVLIRTAPANGADTAFSVGQIAGDGHLIPVSFEFSAFDTTRNMTIFDSGLITKGGGNANRNQTTTTCSSTETSTLGELLDPGETPPPGTSASDMVTFTITVTAIVKP